MRPVTVEHVVSQYFAQMPTAGVRGDIKAVGTVAYYVALYGNYQPHGHAGMDFKCPVGTPIYAMADGTVLYAGWSEDLPGTGDVRKWLLYYNFGGIITAIQHDGWISITAHQSDNDMVHVGMKVKQGQLIGKSGDTKTRTTKVAPHVHIEALVDLSYKTGGGLIYGRTDPSKFFTEGLATQGTINPIQEDDVSAQEVMSWPIERTDKQMSTVAVELARLGPDLAAVKTMLEAMAPKVDESMLNDRKQVYSLEGLWGAVASIPATDIAAKLNAAGIAADVRDELMKLLGGK